MERPSMSWWTRTGIAFSSTLKDTHWSLRIHPFRLALKSHLNLGVFTLCLLSLAGCSTTPGQVTQIQLSSAGGGPPPIPPIKRSGTAQRSVFTPPAPKTQYLVLSLGEQPTRTVLVVSVVPTGFTPLLTLPPGTIIVHDYDYTNVPARYYRCMPLP